MNFKFKGVIVTGKPKLSDGGALQIVPNTKTVPFILNELRNYKGGEVTCIVSDDIEPWSNQMNDLFEGLVRKWFLSGDLDFWELMRCAPQTFDEVRMYCKIVFLECKHKFMFDNRQVEVQSITTLGKKKFSAGIDALMNHLIMKGINIDQEKTDYESLKGD